jgi:hypothetical protein
MVSNPRKDFACYQCGHNRFEGITGTNGMIGDRQVARARCLQCGTVADGHANRLQLPKFVGVTGAFRPLSGEPPLSRPPPPSPSPPAHRRSLGFRTPNPSLSPSTQGAINDALSPDGTPGSSQAEDRPVMPLEVDFGGDWLPESTPVIPSAPQPPVNRLIPPALSTPPSVPADLEGQMSALVDPIISDPLEIAMLPVTPEVGSSFRCPNCGNDQFEQMGSSLWAIGEVAATRAYCSQCLRLVDGYTEIESLPAFVAVAGKGKRIRLLPPAVLSENVQDQIGSIISGERSPRPPSAVGRSGLVAHYISTKPTRRPLAFLRRRWVPRKRILLVSFVLGAVIAPVFISPLLPDSLATFLVDYQTWIASL